MSAARPAARLFACGGFCDEGIVWAVDHKIINTRATKGAAAAAVLVEEYRDRCLWFLRKDYVPETRDEILRVLELIERYGDRSGYRRAEEIRRCL